MPSLGVGIGFNGGKFLVAQLSPQLESAGLRKGDEVLGFNDTPLNMETVQEIVGQIEALGIGDPYVLKVKRGDEELSIETQTLGQPEVIPHSFEIDPEASDSVVALREAWLKNLVP